MPVQTIPHTQAAISSGNPFYPTHQAVLNPLSVPSTSTGSNVEAGLPLPGTQVFIDDDSNEENDNEVELATSKDPDTEEWPAEKVKFLKLATWI